jgi:hypothetical protein
MDKTELKKHIQEKITELNMLEGTSRYDLSERMDKIIHPGGELVQVSHWSGRRVERLTKKELVGRVHLAGPDVVQIPNS